MIPPRPALRDLARRFPTVSERCYVRGKLASDPLYPAVLRALDGTDAPLLDIGCGMGLLGFYLRLGGWMPPISGIDYDARKIKTACRLAPDFPGKLDFARGDAMAGLPPHSGSVTILDILQYFPVAERARLLAAAADRVSPGGVLVIRTGLTDSSLRFHITRAMDHVASLARWMKSPPLHYPTAGEITDTLARAGLDGRFTPLWGRTPFNNWLGVFRRANSRD